MKISWANMVAEAFLYDASEHRTNVDHLTWAVTLNIQAQTII